MARELPDDHSLLIGLRAGDERTFMLIVEAWSPGMLRLARAHVHTDAIAEEVVQEAWLGVLHGLARFEGRSALKTWTFRILLNTAKTRGEREARSLPFSAASDDDDPTVDPGRFRHGAWSLPPAPFPEDRLAADETRDVCLRAIAGLPPRQREVITLRDIEGFSAEEACNTLEVEETNQRVLLHRARAKVRADLERHFESAGGR